MHKMSTTMSANSSNNNDTNSSLNSSQTHFYPITKSVSVPDIHNNHDVHHSQVNSRPHVLNNLLLTNSESIESAIADSPAGSLEQFEVNANTPLSTDDQVDSIADTLRESHPNSNNSSFSSVTTQKYDSNSPSFRFRRHSSQSAINANSSQPAASSFSSTNREICSSPINSLKMSSRVCQIKIDEGIEPHLSREIKSEREMQNTLKLKTSCDELILNNDDLSLETFTFDNNRVSNDINRTNSPVSATISSVTTFRQNSQSNMPSPSMSSCYSYSNSSSPTAGLSTNNNNPGLLRCFSPSTALANNSINASVNQNYFSQSPSPTRKLFVTRRSMSPIQLRPSTLSGLNSNNKRKLSDLDASDSSQIALCSPKRSNNDNQEFVQPLQIFTGTNANLPRPIGTVRSLTSSPFSSLSTTPSSPNQNSISSLIITSGASENNSNQLRQDLKLNSDNKTSNSSSSFKSNIESKTDDNQPKFLWPSATIQSQNYINNDNSNKTEDKYTFKPIQLPPPATNFSNPQRKRFINTLTTSSNSTNTASFSSLAQVNQSNNSPMNSPAHYLCDSPISYSPSVSNISSSIAGEKPDSGYQSSIQNNSDSESCI